MDLFLNEIFSFPTIVFAFPLVIFMLFWLLAFAGLVDIEIFDIDGDIEPDIDTDPETQSVPWLQKLGLDGVPLIVALTLLDIYAFAFTYLARKHLLPLFDGVLTATAIGAITAFVAVVIALPITAVSVKPLRRLFHTHEAITKNELIGTICTVSTQTVSETFGQVTTDDGMTLSVFAKSPNTMARGSRVVLIEFNKEQDIYQVVTEEELMEMSS
jgi:hypothetical protein